MPLYDYECRVCGEVFEKYRHHTDLDKPVMHCGLVAKQILGVPTAHFKDFQPYLEENTGYQGGPPILMTSRRQRERALRERGLRIKDEKRAGMPGRWV